MANACMLSRATPFLAASRFSEQSSLFPSDSLHACLVARSSFVGSSLYNAPLRRRPASSSSWSSLPFSSSLSIQWSSQRRPQYVPNRIDDPNYVRIFDTTLRDGEESPGATLTSKVKLDIAGQLAKLGVDIIEAGFPIASPDDLEAVKLIAREVGNDVTDDGYVPVICGLARSNKADIDAAWEGVEHALRPHIHTFIATSEIHMQYMLRKSPKEVVKIARDMVSYARSLGCEDIEFSPEDAGRSDPEFLYRILEEVIKAGATTLNIPDTVGYTLPLEFDQLIANIKDNTKGAHNVLISTHCQNDLGLATANTLAGAANGARQLEVTINGIGERAGNASLEEVCTDIDAGKDKLNSPICKVELLYGWGLDIPWPALISFPASLYFLGSAHAEVFTPQINHVYGDLGSGVEFGVQVLYLAALLGLVGVASYFVVKQVLIRRELESAARDLQDRVRTGEALPVEYFELGAVMLRKKFYALASKYLELAIAKWDGDPQDLAQVHNALGFSYVSDEQVDRGIAEYQKAVKLQPGYVIAWNNLGAAYEKKKNLAKALEAYEQALLFDPNNGVAKEYRDALKKRVERLEGVPAKYD